ERAVAGQASRALAEPLRCRFERLVAEEPCALGLPLPVGGSGGDVLRMAGRGGVVAAKAVLEVGVVEPRPHQLGAHALGYLRSLVLDLVECRQVGPEPGVAHLNTAELALDAVELTL